MGNSASAALPYTIDTKHVVSTTQMGWTVHGGVRQSDGTTVTAFCGKKPVLRQRNTLQPSYHHFQHAKKLRHPMLLQVYATLDTDNMDGTAAAGTAGTGSAAAAAAAGDSTTTPASTATTIPLSSQKGEYIIVTEPCMPLTEWLRTTPPPRRDQLSWAVYCMIHALDFLHQSATMAHGNLSADESWMVTPGGDVKLWNYGLVVTKQQLQQQPAAGHFPTYEGHLTPQSYRSPERIRGEYTLLSSAGVHCMDAYGLGILLQNVLFASDGGGVPTTLQKAVRRLLSANPRARPRLRGLLQCPLLTTSSYVALQQQLSELHVQPVEQKIHFWQQFLSSSMVVNNGMSPSLAVYKILPLVQSSITTIASSDVLVRQDLYKREVLSMLPILFTIWEQFPTTTLDGGSTGAEGTTPTPTTTTTTDFGPTIGLLMRIQDRGVRGALLNKLSLIVRHEFVVDNGAARRTAMLNTNIFEPMCSGFSDSSPIMRELTLKSSLILVPHLLPTNLEKLSRYLTRLQGDSEASIRTNAVLLMIRVIPHLTPVQQEKMLVPSLTRGLQDPFDPCRLACLSAIMNYDTFTPDLLATRVIPIVSPKCMDGSSTVRRKAFQVMTKCLERLQETHEEMTREEELRVESTPGTTTTTVDGGGAHSVTVPSAGGDPAVAPSSGGYLSGLSSWMTSSAKPEQTTATGGNVGVGGVVATGAVSRPVPTPTTTTTTSAATMNTGTSAISDSFAAATTLNSATDGWDDDDDDNDGWDDVDDDDDGDKDLLRTTSTSKSSSSNNKTTAASLRQQQQQPAAMLNMKEEEDFFKSFDTKHVPLRSTGGRLAVPSAAAGGKKKKTTAPPPKITKLKVDANDDWDDF